LIKKHLIFET
jgi:hypothetical protein